MHYLKIKNFEHYQHYSARNPPWIKFYRSILNDYELRSLSVSCRLTYIYCLILASETDNRIPDDRNYLASRFGFPVSELILTTLIDSGFLLASGARRVLAIDANCSSLPTLLLTAPPNSDLSPDLKSNTHTSNGRVKSKGKRAICDEDKPTEKNVTFGRTLNLDVGPEWGKFKNYCLAEDRHYANFEAAFRNWLARAAEHKGARHAVRQL